MFSGGTMPSNENWTTTRDDAELTLSVKQESSTFVVGLGKARHLFMEAGKAGHLAQNHAGIVEAQHLIEIVGEQVAPGGTNVFNKTQKL